VTLRVLESGFFTTIQDLGRKGYQKFGVPVSGVMDTFASSAANRLVGNLPDAAVIEISPGGATFIAEDDCLIAVTGNGFSLSIHKNQFPFWLSIFVRANDTIRISPQRNSGWAYLAVAGGVKVPIIMESSSTYIRGKFGGFEGRVLTNEDRILTGSAAPGWKQKAGSRFSHEYLPPYSESVTVRVIPGPQLESFSSAGIQTFLKSPYQIITESDRMGYRLEGPVIEHITSADIISEGMALGSIQVPANGQPIIMLSDRQTVGGYTKIATIILADTPLIAQCPIGSGLVRFQTTTLEIARQSYLERISALEMGIEETEDT